MKQIIILALIILECQNQCRKRCLKCSQDSKCLICDAWNNFFLESSICVEKKNETCGFHDIYGKCLECKVLHYLDLNTSQCLKVQQADLINNCLRYDSLLQCVQCQKNFFLLMGRCVQVKNEFQNCEYYGAFNSCIECKEKYMLNSLGNQCIPVNNNLENCHYMSDLNCLECKKGFLLNRNYYINQLYDSQSIQQHSLQLLSLMKDFRYQANKIKSFDVCQKIEVQNCFEYQDFQKCKKCQENYFLDSNQLCQEYPKPQIQFCSEYSSQSICSKCNERFYLKNNSCFPVEPIENCILYSQSSLSKCLECESDFLLENKLCVKRVKSFGSQISFCLKKEIESDQCAVCQENYILVSDGLRCLKRPENCAILNNMPPGTETATCGYCNQYYFNNQGSCYKGTIPNCFFYKSQDICIFCDNGYFLKDVNNCQKNKIIDGCLGYSGRQNNKPNDCEKCDKDSYLFNLKTICINVVPIVNCRTYKSNTLPTECVECEDGYFLQSPQSCVTFDSDNCLKGNSISTCTLCDAHHVLSQNDEGVCVKPFLYTIANCLFHKAQEKNSIRMNDLKCDSCIENHEPINMENQFICIQNDYLKHFEIDFVENCLKYGANKQCMLCKEGYYLEEVNQISQCVSECSEQNGLEKVLFEFSEDKGFQIVSMEKCSESNSCKLFAPISYYDMANESAQPSTENSSSNMICIECPDTHARTIMTIHEEIASNITRNSTQQSDPFQRNVQISCKVPKKINDVAQKTLLQNCDYYYQKEEGELFCIKCSHGYNGKVIRGPSLISFVEKCELMVTCNSSKYFFGLPPVLDNLVTCHQCTDSSKIPLIGLSINNQINQYQIKNIRPYSLQNKSYQVTSPGMEEKLLNCLLPNQMNTFTTDNVSNNLPKNCGIGVLNLDTVDGDSSDASNIWASPSQNLKLSQFCGACQPGYLPQFLSPLHRHIVLKCTQIQNCSDEISTKYQYYFNKCSQCKYGHVFFFDEFPKSHQQIDYTRCIQNTVSECYASDQQTSCRLCMKGFVLNRDKKCDGILSPQCVNQTFSSFLNLPIIHNVLNYSIFYSQFGNGCNQCAVNFSGVLVSKKKYFCVFSNYLKQKKNIFPSQSNYINFCSSFGILNEVLICLKCLEGYILRQNKSECLNTVPNCLVAANEGNEICSICEPEFALVNYRCVLGNMPNCMKYYENVYKTQMECQQCLPGFYMDINSNICKRGAVKNCYQYFLNNPFQCMLCKEGFAKLISAIDVCYPIDPSLNCNRAQELTQDFVCNQCSSQNQIQINIKQHNELDYTQSICMKYEKVENCEEHHLEDIISKTSFQCVKCKTDYYLKEYACHPRIIQISNCIEFDIFEDKCKNCSPNFFLNNLGTTCESYPKGIIGCLHYSNYDQCSMCNSNFYLKDNECLKVETEKKVAYCLYYSIEQKCIECDSQFYLEEGQCFSQKIDFCLVIRDEKYCEQCIPGFGLTVKKDGTTLCVQINRNNCQEIQQEGNFECLKCNQGFYPNIDGNCVFSPTQIEGCAYQKNSSTCMQCEEDKVLSKDMKECLQNDQLRQLIDKNCQNSVLTEEIFCSSCAPGFIFNDGECTKCQSPVSFEEGCFICDYQHTNVCLLCNEGFYMDKTMKCTKEVIIEKPITEELANYAMIKSFLMGFFALLFLINQWVQKLFF